MYCELELLRTNSNYHTVSYILFPFKFFQIKTLHHKKNILVCSAFHDVFYKAKSKILDLKKIIIVLLRC